MVEEGVIRHVDEELAGGAILIGGTRHRDGAAGVAQAVVCFILDRRVRLLLLHLFVKAAALHHESRDHAVKGGVVVEAAVDVLQEVIHGNRGFLAV